jgi:hypothetical protein
MSLTTQLDLFSQPDTPSRDRWVLTRPMAASRLRQHALSRLEFVRRHFPELDAVTVKVGRTTSRRAHAWASLNPAMPAIWIKPGALPLFTVTHELTHLLQARGLAPRGEKTADLWALARHPELIDKPPTYLRVPRVLFGMKGDPRPGTAVLLHRTARRAIAEAPGKPRRAVRLFEEYAAMAAVPSALRIFDMFGPMLA